MPLLRWWLLALLRLSEKHLKNMPKKDMSGDKLLKAWRKAKRKGITRREFAESLGISEKILDNRLYRAMHPDRKKPDQKTNRVTDAVDGNYRTITSHGTRYQSVDELLKALQVDLTVWRIDDRHEVGSWEMGRRAEKKNLRWEGGSIQDGYAIDDGTLYIDTLHRFKVPLVRIHPIPIEPIVKPVIISSAPYQHKAKWEPTSCTTLLVSDLQTGYRRDIYTGGLIPFHDRAAMDLVLQVAADNDFDSVTYLGDFGDFSEWTDKFIQELEFAFTTQPMLIEVAWYMAQMKQIKPKARHSALPGNHEDRFESCMVKNLRAGYKLKPATELHLDEPMSIKRMFGLDSIGVDLADDYPNGEVWHGEYARCIHGAKAAGNPGATAVGVARDITHTTLFGHIHRIEQATKTVEDSSGIRYVTAASPGCLCHIDYRVPGHKRGQNWQQGFGVLHYGSRSPQVDLFPIFEGKTVYNGKQYQGRDYVERLKADTNWKF